MAIVRIWAPVVSRNVSFHVNDRVKSTQKKLYENVIQRKSWPMPRLMLGNLGHDHEQEDHFKGNNQEPKLKESDQPFFIGGPSDDILPTARVEYTNLGYRPVLSDDLSSATLPYGWLPYEQATRILNARIEKYRGMELDPDRHFDRDFARYLSKVWMQKDLAEKYYERALAMEPWNPRLLVEYAVFSWVLMGNEEKADELFDAALQKDPHDPIILGSYAFFLWQREI
ncbi:hypothetical protein SUGI_0453360 [Cryptomeria japonica]|nr:hypothetical protein SUGI_0453360 [Cryptomeria japonica]